MPRCGVKTKTYEKGRSTKGPLVFYSHPLNMFNYLKKPLWLKLLFPYGFTIRRYFIENVIKTKDLGELFKLFKLLPKVPLSWLSRVFHQSFRLVDFLFRGH